MSRVPTALYALFLLQFFCAMFFLLDGVADLLGYENAIGWRDTDSFEYLVAGALLLSVFYTGRQLLGVIDRQKRMEGQLRAASGAFHEILEEHFDEWSLTPSERDVALLTIKGLTIAEIGEIRETSQGTIKTQCNSIYRKAGVGNRTQLVSLFVEELVELPDRRPAMTI